MTPEQRYLFDVSGYLHLKGVLTGKELQHCQQRAETCIRTPVDKLPAGMSSSYPGTETGVGGIGSGFSFDKPLERLLFHPVTWPIIKELTNSKPRFDRGTLAVNTHITTQMTPLHCAREDFGWQSTRYEYKNGRIFCDTFVIFFYLTDVYPGDGGLIDLIEFEGLAVDKIKQLVLLDNSPINLSTAELEALLLFVSNANKPLSRDFLVENLRGIQWQTCDRSVDVLVSRLRQKLGETPNNTRFIKTVHGIGYRFIGVKK